MVLSQHSRLGPQRVCISVPPPASMQPDLCRNQWLPINEELIYIFISTWEQRRAFSYWDSSGLTSGLRRKKTIIRVSQVGKTIGTVDSVHS